MDGNYTLLIERFPRRLRNKLRREAFDRGITLRALVIEKLSIGGKEESDVSDSG